MKNGHWSVIVLNQDRTLFFDENIPGKYGSYDLNALENSNETFERVVLLKFETSKIESSIVGKDFLIKNMFVETSATNPEQQTMLLPVNVNEQSIQLDDQTVSESFEIQNYSIVNINDDKCCPISLENIQNLSKEHFIGDDLEYDDDLLQNTNTRLTFVEKGLAYIYERQSTGTIIKLLNDHYLIDIRQLDARLMSSFESEAMQSFFRLVAFYMKKDYDH
ncbi:unnamed protein product [Rotaria sordida]|uniref:Uncharacterized protein n=1 Tax=Rotaria sordida TaxID=392033 RepID=A0A815FIL3_9BILA|nr:unnamed protein product [Rotaria sordida]CAF1325775.1 unnamed protein product [Rotaria sordida]